MQGRNKVVLPGANSNISSNILATALGQRRLPTQLASVARGRRGRLSPGKLPRLAAIQAGPENFPGATSGQVSPAGFRQEADKPAEPVGHGPLPGQRARPARPLYKVSEDPLLRQTQMLLEASRRLREQSLPLSSSNVDREGYYGCSSGAQGVVRLRSSGEPQLDNPDVAAMGMAMMARQRVAPLLSADTACEGAPEVASFGSLAAASATAAARLTAAHISAVNAATAAAAAKAPTNPALPTVATDASAATAAGRAAMTAAATSASVAVVAAALPPAASAASAAAGLPGAAASAAASSWYYIEELLEEAAYSLSQELPGGQASSPLDALMASSSGLGRSSGPVSSSSLQGLSQSVALPNLGLDSGVGLGAVSELGSGAASAASGLVAAVPGGDMLSELLEDLLYSLSQEINLAGTQEALVGAATAAAAGLAGAAAELPRAAAAVYRSAAEAAAAAAAARAASARGALGGGSGGTALVVPDEGQSQLESGQEYDMEADIAATLTYDNAAEDSAGVVNPPWDPYGTIRAATEGPAAAVPDTSAAAAEAASSAAAASAFEAGSGTVASAAVSTAASAATSVADGAAAPLPIVTASAAPTVADAATATAAAVVEAATTAAAGTIVVQTAPPPPVAAPVPAPAAVAVTVPAPSPPAPASAAVMQANGGAAASSSAAGDMASNGGDVYGMDGYGLDPESAQQLDELTAALQSLLAVPEGASSAAAVSGLDAGAEAGIAAMAAAAAAVDPSFPASAAVDAEAAVSSLTEALRTELGAVVGGIGADADPTSLAQAAGQAVSSALSAVDAGQVDLTALPQDARLSSLMGATLQSSLELVEAALGGVRSADSTLVGGVTIAAVIALLIRALVSLAGSAMSRSREGAARGAQGVEEAGAAGAGGAGGGARVRPVGVTALEAAAALNNDPQALLLDIRNGSDVEEQGLPDLRPFRRGAGATSVPLPYCDFRTTPTLANPSGSLSLLGAAASASSTSLVSSRGGLVTVAVDPQFVSKFLGTAGLDRDSRVFLLDSFGVEAAEAVMRLRADPRVERLLGAQGVKYVEGGFAGPEGWKLTGLPVMDAPLPEGAEEGSRPGGLGVDLGGLVSGVAGLRVRYPSLFSRTLAVGAAGGAGLAVASSLDWGAVSRGAVGLAAAMLVTDRVLPKGVRPSAKIRQYLQTQLSDPQLTVGAGANGGPAPTAADLAAARRRTALLLRALDLAEAVGDAVVKAGGAAVTAAGSAAKSAIAGRAADTVPASPVTGTAVPAAADTGAEADLETPPPVTATGRAATIVLPHGMDSPQWSEAAELAVAQGQQQQQQPQTPAAAAAAMAAGAGAGQPQAQHQRSASPLRPNCKLGPATPEVSSSSKPTFGAVAAKAGVAASEPLPPPQRSVSPSLAGRLGSAIRNATDAVVRAASPSRAANGDTARSTSPRSVSPRGNGTGPRQPDTLELMTALATASALSSVDSGLVPGWPAVNFPKATAGQAPPPAAESEGKEPAEETDTAGLPFFSSFVASASSSSSPSSSGLQGAKDVAGAEQVSPWSSWRHELEQVAPPPPSLLTTAAAASSEGEGALAAAPATGVPLGSGRSRAPAQQQPQPASPQRAKRPLRTSSPERAAAAGAAMRLLRMQMDGLDDDGLGSGAYGSGGFYAGSSDTEGEAAAGGKRSGSAGVAAARMARGTGGLSPGLQAQRQQAPSRPGSGGGAGRQKQPLRTASPERAAAAAAAMRQLRAEMGLPPNDGSSARSSAAPALVPRDWRRELEAAAASPEMEDFLSSSEEEEARADRFRQAAAAAAGAASTAAAAASVAVAPSRSPRNWRNELEGRGQQLQYPTTGGGGGSSGGAPADWRTRLEGGSSSGGSSSSAVALRSSSSPGRAGLTTAERAERDARLQDWRARV